MGGDAEKLLLALLGVLPACFARRRPRQQRRGHGGRGGVKGAQAWRCGSCCCRGIWSKPEVWIGWCVAHWSMCSVLRSRDLNVPAAIGTAPAAAAARPSEGPAVSQRKLHLKLGSNVHGRGRVDSARAAPVRLDDHLHHWSSAASMQRMTAATAMIQPLAHVALADVSAAQTLLCRYAGGCGRRVLDE